MRHQVIRSMLVAAALVGAAPAHAALEADGGQPGSWLMNYAGARTLGLGGSFVAAADNALGVLWNPAGLPGLDRSELLFENTRLFEDTSVNGLGFAMPGNWLPSFGLCAVSMRSGDFQRTNEMNDDLGSFRETETAYVFTLAKGFSPRFAVGANLKVLQQTVEDWSAGGVGFDAGVMARVLPSLRVGAAVLNVGGPSPTLRETAEPFPTQVRGGFALEVLGGRGLVTAEVDHAGNRAAQLHAGSEYWIQPGIGLRVGFQNEGATGGFSYRFAPQYQVDYGVADHALGLSHRVGVSYRFAGFFASSQAEPEAFSPTGEKATTQIRLAAHTKTDAENWSLDLVNKTGDVVRRFSGPGLPPAHVQWDGKDETGLPMADGVYAYRLTVKDKDGRVLVGPTRHVEIATGGPQGDVPVVTTQP
jgi:hypothetical protein